MQARNCKRTKVSTLYIKRLALHHSLWHNSSHRDYPVPQELSNANVLAQKIRHS